MFKLFDSKTADPITHHQVGNQSLEVVRTTRKNSMALQIRGNKVVILVPKRHSPQRLIKVLCDNQAWLLQSLMRLEQRRLSYPEAMVFTGNWGDTFDFLGEAVTLVPQDRGGRN
ncbi:MAG: hypothetical protein L3J38_07095, partial [Thiomicrorhabdus sp.]|nr:hypothetical protein [Thiomicrorhabdus sp.]